MWTRFVLLSGLFGTLLGCGRSDGAAEPPVRAFAAASTRNAINEIATRFSEATGIPIVCEFGASSTLARQIEQGAEADLFLSADEEWADYLGKKDRVVERQLLLTNRLVVVVPVDSTLIVKQLADVASDGIQHLAVAGEAVPAGRYARQALRKAGVWGRVEGRLLEGKDVTAVLLYVARGEADAGFVYATDAAASSKVRIACEVPESYTVPIRYPLVTVRRNQPNPDATRFADYLAGETAGAVFRQAGFGLVHTLRADLAPPGEKELDPINGRGNQQFLGLAREDWAALGFSATVSAIAVAFSLPFGVGLGWLLARRPFPGKALVETALNLPLVLPPVVTGYLLLVLFGKHGPIGGWLDRMFGIQVAFTAAAAALAAAVMGFPLLVRAVRLAFQGTDPRLYQAARSLGARPLDAFLTVSLPLARNGVIAGVVLSFARGLGEFGATLLFVGSAPGRRTLAVEIYQLYEVPGEMAEARMWRLVGAAVLLACAALAASEYLERRGARRESA